MLALKRRNDGTTERRNLRNDILMHFLIVNLNNIPRKYPRFLGSPKMLHFQTLRSRQISKLPKFFLCQPEMTAPVKKHLIYNKKSKASIKKNKRKKTCRSEMQKWSVRFRTCISKVAERRRNTQHAQQTQHATRSTRNTHTQHATRTRNAQHAHATRNTQESSKIAISRAGTSVASS